MMSDAERARVAQEIAAEQAKEHAKHRTRAVSRPRPHRRHGGVEPLTDLLDAAPALGVSLDDFYAYMPQHVYIFTPTREVWPASSVDARIAPVPLLDADGAPVVDRQGKELKIAASAWLDRHRPVEQMTWLPGAPLVIENRLVAEGGWIERPGCQCFNLYRPPLLRPGDATQVGRWLEYVARVYPDDASHIVQYLAYKVQHPEQKINHALVLGGAQGIGKDTILEPIKAAVGPWNFIEVSPPQLLGRFNGFLKSVILRVSEVRDLGEIDRYSFYDHLKAYTAAPPDVLRVDEKHLREYSVWNVCGVILTTNHKTNGLYLPADDRRHYVAWSILQQADFEAAYWKTLYRWYEDGGTAHVAAYLATLDLSGFDPKAPPPKTEAFWDIVTANRAPEDAELSDVLDALSTEAGDGRKVRPNATTIAIIAAQPEASQDFDTWLRDRRNSRLIPHRMESVGYTPVRNPATESGLWTVQKRRTVIYVPRELSIRERIAAAEQLSRERGEQ